MAINVGLAIGDDSIAVHVGDSQDGAATHCVTTFSELRALLTEISKAATSSLRLSVAVMPAAGHCRLVDLPDLRPSELRELVRRYPDRFFLLRNDDISIGVADGVVAVGYNDVLDRVRGACEPAWSLRFVPSEAAWLHAAEACVAVRTDKSWTVVQREKRGLASIRRLPASIAPGEVPVSLGMADDAVHIIASGADEVAARYAHMVAGPVVQNATELEAARAQRRRSIAKAGALSLFVLFGAIGIETANLRLDTAAISAHRQELKARAATAAQQLTDLRQVQRGISELNRLPQQHLMPVDVLLQLGEFLPEDAFVSEFSMAQDSATVVITSEDAATAVRALRRSQLFSKAEVQGSIKRITSGGDSIATESIRLSLSVMQKGRKSNARPRG